MTHPPSDTGSYWGAAFAIEESDLEHLYNLLLESETPQTGDEMAAAIIRLRCERELKALQKRKDGVLQYLPKEAYEPGRRLVFPALEFAVGVVTKVRPGHNPDRGEFDVISVDFEDGRPPREFAGRLPDHLLNTQQLYDGTDDFTAPETIVEQHGEAVAAKLEAALQASADIVRLAGRWFPRSLLIDINVGHLNLAEAVLDMAGGGPLPTEALLAEVGLSESINARLQAFSLNYALQEDERFDEVGPAGQVLWYLRRLEPPEVIYAPRRLENSAPDYEPGRLDEALLALEQELDDELSPAAEAPAQESDEITLTFPHLRVGTLPLSSRLKSLFPTAYVTPRIRFMLVDGESGDKFPGWVVRQGGYVFGLDEWYQKVEMPAGGQLTVSRGDAPGEVVVKAARRRPAREWVRTATAGPDGQLAFAMQKKLVAVDYDDLMIVAVDSPVVIDEVWLKSQSLPFDRLVADVFRELAKLNPQSAVHAKTLYAAVNVARRSPPGPIFAELLARPYYAHVGDAYWRFDQSHWTE